MYDNNCSNNCGRASTSICINAGYVAVVLAVIAGALAYFAFTRGLLVLVPALSYGILGILVILGGVVLTLVNSHLIKCRRLCCCAKQRVFGYLITAILALVALGLYFAVASIGAILVAVLAALFVLAILFFIGFYQCFLKCHCNNCTCECNDCDD